MAATRNFSRLADLLDRETADLPSINTPLADALAAIEARLAALESAGNALLAEDGEALLAEDGETLTTE